MTNEENIGNLKRIIVSVPFVSSVQYEIAVKNPEDLEEIKEKLREKDASEWMHEPNFYEELGQNWDENIEEIEKDGVFVPPPVKPGDRIYVSELGECSVVEKNNPFGIDVTMVSEEDKTISWILNSNVQSSDIGLEGAKVIPVNKEE